MNDERKFKKKRNSQTNLNYCRISYIGRYRDLNFEVDLVLLRAGGVLFYSENVFFFHHNTMCFFKLIDFALVYSSGHVTFCANNIMYFQHSLLIAILRD